jgi:hypothetical protein
MEDDLRLMMDRLYIPKLVQHLVEHQIEVLSVQPRHSLEDYFIQLTQTN